MSGGGDKNTKKPQTQQEEMPDRKSSAPLPSATLENTANDVAANPGHVAEQQHQATLSEEPQSKAAASRDEEGINMPASAASLQQHATGSSGKPKKIAVLTSGGDSAGMNAAVRAVVRMGIARGCQAYIIREGWEGLVRGNKDAVSAAVDGPTSGTATPVNGGQRGSSLPPTLQATQSGQQDQRSVDLSSAPLSFGFGELLKDGAGEGEEEIDAGGAAGGVGAAGPNAVTHETSYGLHTHHGRGQPHHHHQGSHHGAVAEHHGAADTPDQVARKSLKGMYIVRVGWDDVRGWLGEGGTLIGSSRCPACECDVERRQAKWRGDETS